MLASLAASDIQVSPFKVAELWPPQDPAKRMEAREAERRKVAKACEVMRDPAATIMYSQTSVTI